MTEMNRIARPDLERLSAFLDGELSPAEAEQLEARLATDQLLSSTLEALRATSEVVGSLPEVRPPRSFALTQEMTRPRRAYPFLRLSTAVAALGFILVVGADLLLSGISGSSIGASDQAFFSADQITEQLGDSAPAEAPAQEEAIAGEAERELALPAAESAGEAEDGIAQDFFRSDEDAAAGGFAEQGAAEPEASGEADIPEDGAAAAEAEGESEFAEESAAAPEAVGESELTDESAVQLEAASGTESAEQEAHKTDADEELSAGRLATNELDFSDEDPSVSLSLLRVIELGLAAALIVLFGLTLWVRQRG